MEIGKVIRKVRLERGATLEAIALAAGTDAANLSRIERGKQGFSEDTIERVAHALELPLSSLYLRAEQESADRRIRAFETDKDDPVVTFRKWLGRLSPENRLLALEFVKMLSRLQEERTTHQQTGPREPL
jgi:transcriptional regulator with XRE-family HTH domain